MRKMVDAATALPRLKMKNDRRRLPSPTRPGRPHRPGQRHPPRSAGEIAEYLYSPNSQLITPYMQPETTTEAAVVENWAILEIMGHERLAGKLTETSVAGVPMLRVEVPATDKLPGFVRLLSGASIFSLTPVPADVATIVAGQLQKTAVSGIPSYGFTFGHQLQMAQALGLPAPKEPTPSSWGQRDDDDPSEY